MTDGTGMDEAEAAIEPTSKIEDAGGTTTDDATGRGTHGDGRAAWGAVRAAVGRAVVGAEDALRLVLVALLADGHALIEDVPGIGKTLLARATARALGLEAGRIQGTPDLLPTDVTGGSILEGGTLRFVPGPVFTNLLLVDEINRATPRTQSALLEAMQERQVTVEGTTRALPEPFIVLATQNPIEFEGTFALPEAQVDRFLLRIRLGYPTEEQERAIARRYRDVAEPLDTVPRVLDVAAILALRERVRTIAVADAVEGYVVALAAGSRNHPQLQLGASPRATVALYRAAQAWAWLAGRDFVLPDDVKSVAGPVLAHRLVVDLDQGLRGATSETIVDELLATVPTPPLEGEIDVAGSARSAGAPASSAPSGTAPAAEDPLARYRRPGG